jgi:hypothetical protein
MSRASGYLVTWESRNAGQAVWQKRIEILRSKGEAKEAVEALPKKRKLDVRKVEIHPLYRRMASQP